MARFNPFAKVSGAYGAPMGRQCDAPGNFVDLDGAALYARHQGGSDGYDRGGAYWGFPSNVYAVWPRSGESVTYVRARSRDDAIHRVRNNLDSL